jgi:hypothetical protein
MFGKIVGGSIKWVLRVAALCVMAAVLGGLSFAFILTRMFTPDHLNSIVTDQLQQIFNRPVIIRSVRVVVFEGIKVSSLRVIDNTNNLGMDFLKSDEVTINYDWLSLLSGQLAIKDISIDSPVINLVKNENGVWNVNGMFKRDAAHKHSSMQRLLHNMDADSGVITDGRVTLSDMVSGYRREFTGVNMKLWDFGFDGRFPVRLSVRAGDPRSSAPPLDVYCEGQLNLADMNWTEASFTNVDMQLGYGKKQISLKGGMLDFRAPEINFEAEVPQLRSGDLAAFVKLPPWFHLQPGRFSAHVFVTGTHVAAKSIKGNSGPVEFTADLQADFSQRAKPVYKIDFASRQFDVAAARDMLSPFDPYEPAGKAKVRLEISGRDGHSALDSLNVEAQGAQFKWHGIRVENAPQLQLSASGRGEKFFPRDMTISAQDAKLKWGGFSASGADLKLAFRNAFKTTDIRVLAGNCMAGSRQFSALSGEVIYSSGAVSVPVFKGKLQNERFRLRMDISDVKSPNRAINVKLDADHVDVPELFTTVRTLASAVQSAYPADKRRKKPSFSGPLYWLRDFREELPQFMPNLTGSAHVGRLTSPVLSARDLYAELGYKGLAPGMKKLNGHADITMGPGVIYQIRDMSRKDKALNVAFEPFLIMHRMESAGAFKMDAVLRNVDYQRLAGSFDFKNGEMTMRNFYLSGPVISATMTGRVGWVSETQDISACTLFSNNNKSGGLPEGMSDASGKPALSFEVENTMLSPKTTIGAPHDCGKRIDDAVKRGVGDFKGIKSFAKGG